MSVRASSGDDQQKGEFGYSRKDIILIGGGLIGLGYALYYGLQAGGMEPGMAGNWVQLIIFMGICVGWVGSYVYRVSTKVRGAEPGGGGARPVRRAIDPLILPPACEPSRQPPACCALAHRPCRHRVPRLPLRAAPSSPSTLLPAAARPLPAPAVSPPPPCSK